MSINKAIPIVCALALLVAIVMTSYGTGVDRERCRADGGTYIWISSGDHCVDLPAGAP